MTPEPPAAQPPPAKAPGSAGGRRRARRAGVPSEAAGQTRPGAADRLGEAADPDDVREWLRREDPRRDTWLRENVPPHHG